MDLGLKGKCALITGGSEGIGYATARTLAREGCSIIITARGQERLELASQTLREEVGADIRWIAADVSASSGMNHIVQEAGEIDILVNNAGAIPQGGLLTVDDQLWRQGWDLKVFGYINLSRAMYPVLSRNKGVIVNVIGVAGERLPPDYLAGAVGNAALMAFTRSLGDAAHKDNMRVVGVSPGPVKTKRLEAMLPLRAKARLGDAERWPELVASMPFGRFAEPEEIADAVAFLASPRSAYTSGTILSIYGGVG